MTLYLPIVVEVTLAVSLLIFVNWLDSRERKARGE